MEDDDDFEEIEDEDEEVFLMGDSHVEEIEQQEQEGMGMFDSPTQKAFIVSKDTVQIVGYEVEEILALAETARNLVYVLEHSPQSKMGFQ